MYEKKNNNNNFIATDLLLSMKISWKWEISMKNYAHNFERISDVLFVFCIFYISKYIII